MFYEGDLQSGIALALQEAKRVVCFVRDDGAESGTWENEYLADTEISGLVAAKSVALRLASGSQEVGFLSSFCPINKVPTIVVINKGVLQEYIVSGTGEDEFKCRLKASLGDEVVNDTSPRHEPHEESQALQTPAPHDTKHIPPADQANSSAPESGLREGENAAEASRKKKIREGKQRAEEVEDSQQPNEDPKRIQQNWRHQQRKREKQDREERERVLAQIQHDKQERKALEEQRKLLQAPKDNNTTQDSSQPKKPPKTPSSEYRLQVRVFDGSSIRSSFSPSHTIRGNVRPWIDQQRTDGDAPYTLKYILNPLPNRTISVTEEEQTLDELGLGPTASLVMVPVQTYTEAYVSNSSLPVRGLSASYNLVSSTVGAVAGVLGTFLGIGQGQPSGSSQSDPQSERPESSSPGPGQRTANSNIRTLHDHRAEQGNKQLYNGNQLNFEPQRDQDKRDE